MPGSRRSGTEQSGTAAVQSNGTKAGPFLSTPRISTQDFVVPGFTPVRKTPSIKDIIAGGPENPDTASALPAMPDETSAVPAELPAAEQPEQPDAPDGMPSAPTAAQTPDTAPAAPVETLAEPAELPAAEQPSTPAPPAASAAAQTPDTTPAVPDEPSAVSAELPAAEQPEPPDAAAGPAGGFETMWRQLFEDLFADDPMIYFPLKDAIPEYENEIIRIGVLNEFQKEEYKRKKRAVLEYWRSHFDLNVNDVTVFVSKDVEVRKVIYSNEDKVQNLQSQNPQLRDFLNIIKFRIKD